GERAAQPAVVHVVLGAALGSGGDRLGRLALGADEQDAAAAGGDFADLHQGLVQQRGRLGQVDDVDVGPRAEDVLVHLRGPAGRLVAEVGAGLEQLAHGEFGQSRSLYLVFLPVGPPQATLPKEDRNADAGCLPAAAARLRVDWSGACSWNT